MKHVMFDLETFGTAPGSVLRSIGAVGFDPEGEGYEDGYYANIDRASCEAIGLLVDPPTEKWWAEQSREAEEQLTRHQKPISDVVGEFHAWFRKTGAEYIWCQGANFDSVLWEAAAKAVGHKFMPWKFWNVRDTRTIYHMLRFNDKTIKRAGTYHNALDDAKHQVACVQAAMRQIKNLGAAPAPKQIDLEDLLA